MSKARNKELWAKAIAAAKRKYTVYPSAYANSYAVSWYKARGGTFEGQKQENEGLSRWHKEKWQTREGKPCGRAQAQRSKAKASDYPECRPTVRVTQSTPKTWG